MEGIDRVAVLGAGDMGHGIAELAALSGYEVHLRDVDEAILEDARERIDASLGELLAGGSIDEAAADRARERIRTTTELSDAVEDADLVVEAVPEDLALKREVFADVEEHAPADAILATNTSALRPTEIGEELDEPSRIVGMHFFNPVMLMDLVEVVPAQATRPDVVETTETIARAMGKTTVRLARDTPGFVTSRLVGAFVRPAIRAREADVATKEEIDAAMRQAGFPMGPFELADHTGIDVGVHAARYMRERLGPAYGPTDTQRRLVEQGKLGKKTGEGFYAWEDGHAQTEPADAQAFDPALVLSVVANEAARLLDARVADAEAIDRAMELGAAFPTGPLRWADERGLDQVLATLETVGQQAGEPLATPARGLLSRAEAGERFHEQATAEET